MVENLTNATNDRRKKAERILSTIYNLPVVPYIIFEVTKIIEDPKASAVQLGEIINKDQGLVTKILSVANSPLYGIPRRVSTIDFAIVILGFNHIKNIVIALSMMEALKSMGDRNFNQRKYWLHSIMTATAAKRIADDLGYHTSGEAFTSGLLHDLGIPIINKYFPKEFKQITDAVNERGISYKEAELEFLGITHDEIGRKLMDRWNLPENLSEVVFNHHQPSKAGDYKIFSALVHLADYMTDKLQIGNFNWDSDYSLDPAVIDILKLGGEEYLENFVNSYRDLFEYQIKNINIL